MDEKNVYKILRSSEGYVIGIELDREFAMRCHNVSLNEASKKRCQDYVWDTSKPKSHIKTMMPADIIWWGNETLLPTMFQHYSDRGKWLDVIQTTILSADTTLPVVYSFHHAGDLLDDSYNRWLCLVFGQWVKCMKMELVFQKESG